MGFRLPNFNLPVKLWRRPATVAGPATRTFNANLSLGKRVNFGSLVNAASLITLPLSELLCPKGTDIYAWNSLGQFSDCVEVPAGSGRFYAVSHVDDVAKGFSNEYRLAFLIQVTTASNTITTNPWLCSVWPVPTP